MVRQLYTDNLSIGDSTPAYKPPAPVSPPNTDDEYYKSPEETADEPLPPPSDYLLPQSRFFIGLGADFSPSAVVPGTSDKAGKTVPSVNAGYEYFNLNGCGWKAKLEAGMDMYQNNSDHNAAFLGGELLVNRALGLGNPNNRGYLSLGGLTRFDQGNSNADLLLGVYNNNVTPFGSNDFFGVSYNVGIGPSITTNGPALKTVGSGTLWLGDNAYLSLSDTRYFFNNENESTSVASAGIFAPFNEPAGKNNAVLGAMGEARFNIGTGGLSTDAGLQLNTDVIGLRLGGSMEMLAYVDSRAALRDSLSAGGFIAFTLPKVPGMDSVWLGYRPMYNPARQTIDHNFYISLVKIRK